MIYPSISDLTKEKYNRYELVIATAKSARMITDEYVKEKETAEKMLAGNKESEKAIANMVKREFRDEKAVKCAINRLYSGEFVILSKEEAEVKRAERAEAARLEEERRLLALSEEPKGFDLGAEDEDEEDFDDEELSDNLPEDEEADAE